MQFYIHLYNIILCPICKCFSQLFLQLKLPCNPTEDLSFAAYAAFLTVQSVLQFTPSTFTLLRPTPWSFICCPSFSNSSLILFSSSFHMSVRTVTSAITMATNNNSELSYSTRHYLGSKKTTFSFIRIFYREKMSSK